MINSTIRISAVEARELTNQSAATELNMLYVLIRDQCNNGKTTYTWFPREEMKLRKKEEVVQQLKMDGYLVDNINENGARIISWKE